MTSQSGGGSGYPGVTSDGNNGLTIEHGLAAGDGRAAVLPDFMLFQGTITVHDTEATNVDGDPVVIISQSANLPVDSIGLSALEVRRSGDVSIQDYVAPAFFIQDFSASVEPTVQVTKGGTPILTLGVQPSVTGALSTVTDGAAKAVLTSIIAALTGISIATDGTT